MHRFTFEVAIHKQSLIMKLAPAQEHVSHNPGPQIDVYPVHPLKNRSCQTESTQGWAVAQGISIWGQSDRVCRSRLAHPFPSHRYEWHAQSKDVWRCRKGKGWKGDLHWYPQSQGEDAPRHTWGLDMSRLYFHIFSHHVVENMRRHYTCSCACFRNRLRACSIWSRRFYSSRGVCFLVLLWHDWVCGICMTSVSLWSAKVFMSYRQKYTGIHTDFSCLDHRCLYLGG